MGHHTPPVLTRHHDGLDVIARYGNRPALCIGPVGEPPDVGRHGRHGKNWLRCHDGFYLSVVAGGGMHCTPRVAAVSTVDWRSPSACGSYAASAWTGMYDTAHDYLGPYTHFEVGYLCAEPQPRELWRRYGPDCGLYNYVPLHMVRDLLNLHGGLRRVEAHPPPGSILNQE